MSHLLCPGLAEGADGLPDRRVPKERKRKATDVVPKKHGATQTSSLLAACC